MIVVLGEEFCPREIVILVIGPTKTLKRCGYSCPLNIRTLGRGWMGKGSRVFYSPHYFGV
jgi:hypothetical protein